MEKLRSCPFCGDSKPEMTREDSKSISGSDMVTFYVLCTHCAARGSSMSGIKNLQGVFEDDFIELEMAAAKYWNDAYR